MEKHYKLLNFRQILLLLAFLIFVAQCTLLRFPSTGNLVLLWGHPFLHTPRRKDPLNPTSPPLQAHFREQKCELDRIEGNAVWASGDSLRSAVHCKVARKCKNWHVSGKRRPELASPKLELHDGMLGTPVLKSQVWKFTSQPSRSGTGATMGLKHQPIPALCQQRSLRANDAEA